MSIKCVFIALLFVTCVAHATFGQENLKSLSAGWSVNLNAGPAVYAGNAQVDQILAMTGENREVQAVFGLRISKELGSVVSVRGQLMGGSLSGTIHREQQVFYSDIFEAGISAVFDLSTLLFRLNSENRRGSVYMSLGAGTINWKTESKDFYSEALLENAGRKTNNRSVVPVGLGYNFRMNHRLDLNFEAMMHMVNSSYLDGNPGNDFDKFMTGSFGITYKFRNLRPSGKTRFAGQTSPDAFGEEAPLAAADVTAVKPGSVEDQVLETESLAGETADPWQDVVFKVQIMASKTRQNVDKLRKRYNITAMVAEEKSGDWFKYTMGEFKQYRKAADFKNLLVTRNRLTDAFVVAYKEGKPIGLRELMQGKRSVSEKEIVPKGVIQDGVTFGVQVLSAKSLTTPVAEFQKKYGIAEETRIVQHGDIFQLVSGSFATYREARELKRRLVENGLADAFVVAYQYGVRIPLRDAYEKKKAILHK
jgi:hypothetical protein